MNTSEQKDPIGYIDTRLGREIDIEYGCMLCVSFNFKRNKGSQNKK
jgi:hypothetical protein